MNESLMDVLIENLEQKTKDNKIDWRIASRDEMPEIRRQFDLNRNEYNLPSPVGAYYCEINGGRIMIMQTIRTYPKTPTIIAADYAYKLFVQPECTGEFIDIEAASSKLNQMIAQIAELVHDDQNKRYVSSFNRKVSKFIFDILEDHDLEAQPAY